jgi:hypothetical protein
MNVEALIVLIAMQGAVWVQDPETKKPSLCIPIEEEHHCTTVPDELLYDWIKATGTEV